MNELTRMQYLDAMGIEMFVPRKILPAAKLSVACPLPYVPVTGELNSVDTQPLLGAPNPVALDDAPIEKAPPSAVANSIVTSLLEPSVAVKAKANTEPGAAPEGRTLQQVVGQKRPQLLRFNLGVWQLANGAVFIDTREPKAGLPTTTLLRNIITAIMPGALAGGLPKPDTINWPLLESPVANPNELIEAREMTHAFLASRFEQASPVLMIVMGEQAFNVVVGCDDVVVPEYGELVKPQHLPSPAVYLPSLTQLLNEPLLKRFIWPAIAPHFLSPATQQTATQGTH